MKKENCYPSPEMKSDCIQRLLNRAYVHLSGTNRRAQLGAFRIIWTRREGNSIADLCKTKNLN